MQVKKATVVPARTDERVDHLVCDLCGAKSKNSGTWAGGGNVNDTTIEMEQGNNWGTDGGDVKVTSFDICPTCFTEKLCRWMMEMGAAPRYEERDW